MDKPTFIAITGTNHYFGTEFIKVGLLLKLVKDPSNPYDEEAIRAEVPPIGKVGYVANSPHTVPRGCKSAGRIYDTVEDVSFGRVMFVVKDTVIVELVKHVEEWQVIFTVTDNCESAPSAAEEERLLLCRNL